MSRSLHSRPCTAAFWGQSVAFFGGSPASEKETAALKVSILTPAKVTTRASDPAFCAGTWHVLNDHVEISSLIAPEQENARA